MTGLVPWEPASHVAPRGALGQCKEMRSSLTGGWRDVVPEQHALTHAVRLPAGSSLLFPASLRTLLEMAPLGSWGLPTALLALLCCSGFGEETFEVYMWPKQVVVERGGLQKINCSTSCLKPESGGLETSLDKTLLDEHVQWKQFLITNISKDMVVLCYFTCSGKQVSSTVNVSVFHAPVLLKLQPTWVTVGRTFTIECRVPALSPLEKLTLTLLRGKEPLHIQTFGKATAVPQEAVATHNITAHREDGHHNFSCQAELDLRSLGGGVLRNVSKPQVVKIYAVAPEAEWRLQGASSLEEGPGAETLLPGTAWVSSGVDTSSAAAGSPWDSAGSCSSPG